MKKIINDAFAILMTAIFLLMFTYIMYTRLANIDMTETRLLLTYWKQYLYLSIAWVTSALIYEATKEKKRK